MAIAVARRAASEMEKIAKSDVRAVAT